MNSGNSIRLPKSAFVLLILFAALAIGIPQQRSLDRARRALAESAAQKARLDARIADATAALESARRDLRSQETIREEKQSVVNKAQRDLTKIDPDVRWSAPPSQLPDWNAESPYIWLRKDVLPRLPVGVFTEQGTLRDEVAAVLTLTPEQQRAVNANLSRILAEYHNLEAAKAEPTDEHLPGIAGEEGVKATVRVPPLPEEGPRFKQQFEDALRSEVGAQRADLLMQAGDGWIDSQFSQFGTEPKIISLIRHPNGTYNISIQSGGSWISTGGPWSAVQYHLPAHLRPLFSGVIAPETATVSQ